MLSALRYLLARRLQGAAPAATVPVRVPRSAARFALAATAAGVSLAALHTGAADTASSSDNELQQRRLTKREALLEWSSGVSADRVNRFDPEEAIEPTRKVIVVVGITGSGKSSTANTICGRTHKRFELSSSITSVTQAVSHRDYEFLGTDYRVIDTPGLCDTNRARSDVRHEILRLARLAKHGVTAFVVVIPRGRFTPEHEEALADILALFGPDINPHSLIAITRATDPAEGRGHLLARDTLVDEINKLPVSHLLRRYVESVHYRLVPVENTIDALRQVSRMALHQRVLELENANGGRTYDVHQLVARAADTDASGASAGSGVSQSSRHGAAALGPCSHKYERLTSGPRAGKWRYVLECDVDEPPASPASSNAL